MAEGVHLTQHVLPEMTTTKAVPDYVKDADAILPGVLEEYSALKMLSIRLLVPREARELELAVLLQCGVAWQHYHAVILLLANRFPIQALILCRTIFELVVGTLYLLKNPKLLPDFVDFGKRDLCEMAQNAGLLETELSALKPEYDRIKSRARDRWHWHQPNIKKMADEVGLGFLHQKFYGEASGAAHADSAVTLSHGPTRGWAQTLHRFRSEQEADYVNYVVFFLIGELFCRVDKGLNLGHENEANAVCLLICERAKSAAMPN